MALFGLGISAIAKGAGALFRSVRNKIKGFKAKRKKQTQAFKDEIKQGFGSLDPYGTGETYARPNNPLGVTRFPLRPPPVTLGTGASFANDVPRKQFQKGKGTFLKKYGVAIGAGALGLIGIAVAMGSKKKKRR